MRSADTIIFEGSALAQDQQLSAVSECLGQQVAVSSLEGHHVTYLGHFRWWKSSTVASGLMFLHVILAPVSFISCGILLCVFVIY